MEQLQMRVRFNPARPGLGKVLGPLEAEIMRAVWQRGPSTVRQIHRILSGRREIAYTTVMTTMSRLFDKGILARNRQGMAYLYRPAMTKAEFDQWVMHSVLGGLIEAYEDKTIDYLVEYLSEEQPEKLEHLRQVLQAQAA
ncbi:MAG: BlaI/MecI/CopY family transcriptional regulator [Chloroflexia bacterium]|nr:BlaI/MecI/CopY family transcriptional regulator [Chloroflexia bacterium]